MNALIIIPDGVSARNFLLGDLGDHLNSRGSWSLLHDLPTGFVESNLPVARRPDRAAPLGPYRETPAIALLRYTLLYGQMEWSSTESMRHKLSRPVSGSWRRRLLHRAARAFGKLAARPSRLDRVDRLHRHLVSRRPETARQRDLLREFAPDVVLCAHQRPPRVVPTIVAAQELGIPTATFIFSWDNLSSKGRIAAPFDHYLVWSDHMADELRRYYPEVAAEQVHVVGTPQFDPYKPERRHWTRRQLCDRLGASDDRPLICYSGGDTANSPEDPGYVRVLLEHIRSGRIHEDVQVVLRPAPVDDGSRFDAIRSEYPELIYAPPAWVRPSGDDWMAVTPTPEDIDLLANLTYHADVNVNLASTMTLDFALHDRPVVNVAFDIAEPPPFGVPIWDYYYRFEHYRPVVELGAARFARTAVELADHINAYLREPSLDAPARVALTRLEVGVPLGASGAAIGNALAEIAVGPEPGANYPRT